MSTQTRTSLDSWSRAGLWLEAVVQRRPRSVWERAGRILLAILVFPIAFFFAVPEATAAVMAWSRYRVVLRTRMDRVVLRAWSRGGDGLGARDLARRLQKDLTRLDPAAFGHEWNIAWRPA